MTGIRLAKLPERTPVKLTVSVEPDLNRLLLRYADFYRSVYGEEGALMDLVPAMLGAFLESDRAFARWRRDANDRKE